MKFVLRMLIMLVVAGVIFGGVFFFDGFRAKMIAHYMKGFANPVQTVATMPAAVTSWQPHTQAVGTLRAMNGADLSADIDGIVEQIDFKSDQDVAAGAVLLTIRGEDDAARTAQLQSALGLARANYTRDQRQLQAQAVSRAVVDTDASTLRSAQAALAQQQALTDKKTIRAPFAGRLGIREVDVGQYLAAGTAIVTLQALDPIYIDFYVGQQQLAMVHAGQQVTLSVDTYPGRGFGGAIEAVNAKVDAATRMVQVRARIANPDHALLPGMFASVSIATGQPMPLVTLPNAAITYNPYGDAVFVARSETQANGQTALIARQVFVLLGDTRGDQAAILKGLQAGEAVVVAGQTKLHNGTPIAIDNSILPANDPAPTPIEQ